MVGFAIHSHESAMGVHIFPILNPSSLPIPSLWSSQCTSPEHPVSCIEPGLVICFTYDDIHVSMLFSQIIPPSPSPTESKSLFFISVSFFAVSHVGSSLKAKVKSLSRARLCEPIHSSLHQAPLSMGFSRQEYWSGLPLPSPTNTVY